MNKEKILIQVKLDQDEWTPIVDKAIKKARREINKGWNVSVANVIRMALREYVKDE